MSNISNGYSNSIQIQQSPPSTTDYSKGNGQHSFGNSGLSGSERLPTQSLYNQMHKLAESIQESPKHYDSKQREHSQTTQHAPLRDRPLHYNAYRNNDGSNGGSGENSEDDSQESNEDDNNTTQINNRVDTQLLESPAFEGMYKIENKDKEHRGSNGNEIKYSSSINDLDWSNGMYLG